MVIPTVSQQSIPPRWRSSKKGSIMRKRLGLFLALAASFVLVSGVVGSAAWFTSQATDPVTTTAGYLHVSFNGADAASITISNMAPGEWTGPYEVNVYNSAPGTLPLKYRITSAFTGGDGNMFNLLNVRVRHTYCGSPNPGSWPVVWGAAGLSALDVRSNTTPGIIANPLGVNITHCFFYEFQLDPSAGNSFQGDSATFNIVVNGAQPADPSF